MDCSMFKFAEIGLGIPSAAMIVDDASDIDKDSGDPANTRRNRFPLIAASGERACMFFYFEFYVSLRNRELYLRYKGLSQKDAEAYSPMLRDGIHAVSLDNAKKELEEYFCRDFIPHAEEFLRDTKYDPGRACIMPSLLVSDLAAPFLFLDKWIPSGRRRIAMSSYLLLSPESVNDLTMFGVAEMFKEKSFSVVDFSVFKGTNDKYIYIVSNGPPPRFMWGVPRDQYDSYLKYLKSDQQMHKELEV